MWLAKQWMVTRPLTPLRLDVLPPRCTYCGGRHVFPEHGYPPGPQTGLRQSKHPILQAARRLGRKV